MRFYLGVFSLCGPYLLPPYRIPAFIPHIAHYLYRAFRPSTAQIISEQDNAGVSPNIMEALIFKIPALISAIYLLQCNS